MQYKITRVRLDAELDSFEQRHLDVFVPAQRQGAVVGMTIYGVSHGSLAHQFSLNNGDVIKDVNGIPATSADEWLRIRDELRAARHLTINFEHQGKPSTLNIAVAGDK